MTTPLRYRAVLFDLDGTLVDSYDALSEAVNHARRTHGLRDLPAGRVKDFVGNGMETLLQRAFDRPSVPRSVVSAFETRYDEVCCSESRVLDDVHATIDRLARLDVKMAVCTNKPTAFSRKILDYFELSRHFGAIVGPDLAGARKPDGRHVLATLELVGASRSEALFVGDMPIDVLAARNSGVDVAVVTTGSSTALEL
jgi:phosphoglycolate phosphatase